MLILPSSFSDFYPAGAAASQLPPPAKKLSSPHKKPLRGANNAIETVLRRAAAAGEDCGK